MPICSLIGRSVASVTAEKQADEEVGDVLLKKHFYFVPDGPTSPVIIRGVPLGLFFFACTFANRCPVTAGDHKAASECTPPRSPA